MPTETSTLLSPNNNLKGSNSHLSAGPLGDRRTQESFVNPQTMEQKVFVGFLFFMIVCLIALGVTVIFDTGSDAREISYSDETAFASMDLLNSLYRGGSTLEPGCESTLLLIRHCDKNTDMDGVVHHGGNNYCSWLGRERSYFFASLFDTPDNPQRRYPAPSKIFALTEERDTRLEEYSDGKLGYREIETVMPLASKFHLEIDVYNFDYEVLASNYFELLQSGDMCGKVTVISWKHEFIPNLALALGCGPAEGCPRVYPEDEYDEVWQMKYVFDPHGKSKTSPDPMDLPVETQRPLVTTSPDPMDLPISGLDDDDDNNNNNTDSVHDNTPNRQLRHKKHHGKSKESKHRHKHPEIKKWSVYGTKTFQHFDPLQFSTNVGDYPPQGSPSGGKWADEI